MADERATLEEQYRTTSNLRARIALHARFSTNLDPYPRWVFDGYDFGERADVLEVGCGDAMIWRENADRIPDGWRLTLTDLSEGMLRAACEVLGDRAEYAVADVEDLPFDDGAFDAVIANHMLFHVDDRPRAFSEIVRVLRPGGRLVTTTVGARHLVELRELAPPRGDFWSKPFERFGIESAPAELEPFFVDVEVDRYPNSLAVTETEPLLDFLRSRGDDLGESRLSEIEDVVEGEIERAGAFRVTTDTARIRCRNP